MSESNSFVDLEKASGVACKGGSGAEYETECFDAAALKARFGIDTESHVWFEIKSSGNRLYQLCLSHIGRACQDDLQSFHPVRSNNHSRDALFSDECSAQVHTHFGLGFAEFKHVNADGDSHTIKAVHQRRGPVVGTSCGADLYTNLILFVEGKDNRETLGHFCSTLLNEADKTNHNSFNIYRWHVEHGYWNCITKKTGRSVDSVVLPSETKDKLIQDLDKFLSRRTYDFYVQHGIPYKRSYLFFGVPGAGKTSLLQAIAAKYRRNLCFMQPTDSKFTDDALQDAINDAPGKALIVLEDVDALFGADRSLSNQKMSITFTGLLNALDGVANEDGQIFVLTTNFREKLDSALIRNGRVDMHVEFKHAQPEQMAALFLQFFPDQSAEVGKKFADAVVEVLDGKKISMAAMQHYFIGKMESSAEEAITGVQAILEDLKEKNSTEQDKASKKQDDKKDSKDKDGKRKKGKKGSKSGSQKGSNINIHIHTGQDDSSSSGSDSE
mmetsp:Transcript_22722/g.35581  ORF Transcript_22722/g.35581 Transcript_22722/m.35581 type:complete len:498 (+) Transcript_22722:168-1661(+)|eukprot:CAMPEP_0184298044 /NCGR_PEP_ID=MMETSP1049-20130417/8903_1 /TAXON_ID=77928 /ORGANISM="Proteomonas sulcata, Strain CCMP704" /LENGTH=497 /DNA_ID=CAMNT_0026608041 /DNA_START=56 /DNA_END=1549 /DNA_ORIENTATION=+